MNDKYAVVTIATKRLLCGDCGKILIPPFNGDSCTMNHVGGDRITRKVKD